MTTWEQLGHIVDMYGATVLLWVLLFAAAWLIYKTWPFISGFVSIVNTIAQLPVKLPAYEKQLTSVATAVTSLDERVATVETAVVTIRKEVTPNGGGSMRDAITQTRSRVEALGKTLEEHINPHGKHANVDTDRP